MTIDSVDALLDLFKKQIDQIARQPREYKRLQLEVTVQKGKITAGRVTVDESWHFRDQPAKPAKLG